MTDRPDAAKDQSRMAKYSLLTYGHQCASNGAGGLFLIARFSHPIISFLSCFLIATNRNEGDSNLITPSLRYARQSL